jgi:hypothetical protein
MARPTARKVAHLPADNQRRGKHLKSQPEDLDLPPSTGRTTKLGRKVEKPAGPPPGGPSGQKDGARHDRKHANK